MATRNVARTIVRILLVVSVLAFGFATCAGLAAMKQAPPQAERVDRGVLVETVTAEARRERVRVEATGVVVPARSVVLSAEVGGRVTWMADQLLPGGRIASGKPLLQIDARDYRLAVEQQYAAVDRARTELELERGRRKIAEREWELLGRGGQGSGSEPAGGNLALREPQLRTAETALKAAESGLERARLSVGKARLSLPFNALVQTRNVDVGQLVTPGTPLATLYGTDEFWVQVLVPVDRLRWIEVPGLRDQTGGSKVRVRQRTLGAPIERTGRVVRLMGDLDPAGRMARVLVAIDDPLGLGLATRSSPDAGAERLPLLVNAYVDVEIEGDELADVIAIPRDAVRGGDKVFVYANGQLAIRPVDIVWRHRDIVLVKGGLDPGARVIVSPIPGAVAGMKLRVDETAAATKSAQPAKAAP
jgi:multidrug efflux pump subunit AcrA (membrane-fusion protein)